jgi:hypothetical protein
MQYRFWVFQEAAPPYALAGNPDAPKPTDPILPELLHPGLEVEGIAEATDRITEVFTEHGVHERDELAVIRSKVTDALLRGSYRTTLPTPGRWLLAEEIQDSPDALNGKAQA